MIKFLCRTTMNINGLAVTKSLLSMILLQMLSPIRSSKIIIFTYPLPSHVIPKVGIGTDLIHRGHEVFIAVASDYPKANTIRQAGLQVLHYRPPSKDLCPYTAEFEEQMAKVVYGQTLNPTFVGKSAEVDCNAIISDPDFMNHVRAMKFDWALVEPFLINPCYLVIPYHLNIPYVSITAAFYPLAFRLPALPSFYIPKRSGAQLVPLPSLQTLSERLSNTLKTVFLGAFIYRSLWGNVTLLQKHAHGIKSWEQLLLKSEMLLVENDHILDGAIPLLPNIVTIAGCTARPPGKLPDSMEELFQQSGDDGVILASFGSLAYHLPAPLAIKFLEAFKRLPQTVLTKMAVPPAIKVPKNVHMHSWLPQNDILGNPRTRLFITHCGSNSQYEALYHGVPMLGIPMFAEQGWNCMRAKNKGIGLCLDLQQFTADELYDTVQELINNFTYRTNVRRLSDIWRDEPLAGIEKAGFWINHVIKYGSSHMRPPSAADQALHQFLMFDAAGIILLALILTVTFVSLFCLFVTKKFKNNFKKIKNE